MRPSSEEVLDRVLGELGRYLDGVHRLGEPAYLLDTELPESLAELYRCFDGGDLFHEALILWPSTSVRPDGERFQVGQVAGDQLWIDRAGALWRRDADGGPLLPEASAIDRFLSGFVDAEALVYDREGEFRDGVFDAAGNLEPDVAVERERALLKRDRRAAGPRYRLGLLALDRGAIDEARGRFEEAVAEAPGHSFAWVELSKISESIGEIENACDEMVEAAGSDDSGEFAPLLWAGAARLAAELGDRDRQTELARAALEAEPDLVEQLCRGAESELSEGFAAEARGLLALARPLAPRHLRVLDLARRLTDGEEAR